MTTVHRRTSGFSLVELMIVVVIVGILAAIAIPTFGRYMRRARAAEAPGLLAKMWAGAVSYYTHTASTAAGTPLPQQFPGPVAPAESPIECGCRPDHLCPGNSAVWNDPTWVGLIFSLTGPHNYIPRFQSSGQDLAAAFTATATADLDCDGVVGSFERHGQVTSLAGDISGNVQPLVTNDLE